MPPTRTQKGFIHSQKAGISASASRLADTCPIISKTLLWESYISIRYGGVPVLWKWERLRLIPLMTIMGFGVSLSTSIAVLEGLMGKGGRFIRTPKLNLSNSHKQSKAIDRSYREPISRLIWAEIALGLYALLTIFMLTPSIGWGIIPWMLIYMTGYFYIAGLNLIQHAPKEVGRMVKSTAG